MPADRAWTNDRAKVARALGFHPGSSIETLVAEIERLRTEHEQGTIVVHSGDHADCFVIARETGDALASVDYEERPRNVDVPTDRRRVP